LLGIHSVHENEVQGVQTRTGPRLMAKLIALHFLIQNVQLHNPTLHFRICVGNDCLQLPDILDSWLTDYNILLEVLVYKLPILCGKFNSTCMTCTVLSLAVSTVHHISPLQMAQFNLLSITDV